MTRKKGKQVSFDVMVKFFMRQYDIPTKKDVKALSERIEKLEKTILRLNRHLTDGSKENRNYTHRKNPNKHIAKASNIVLQLIQESENGIDVPDIKAKTTLNDKQLRNVLYYLNKAGKIKRVSRGVYIAV